MLGKPTLGDLREGIATAPVLFAAEEFPALTPLIERRFKHSGDVERAADWVRASRASSERRHWRGNTRRRRCAPSTRYRRSTVRTR